MKISELDIDKSVINILHEQGFETFYPPQAEAIPYALAGENLVLAIPTASGKSLVAYLAVLKSVLEKGGKALYIVPLRALASEKFEDLGAFKKLGINVIISTGDLDSADPKLENFDIIVATSEKADSLMRHKSRWLENLTVIVADEVHLINDTSRGPTLEVILARFKQLNPSAQIIALSATIQNSEEIAEWLNARHIKSSWRPVELHEGVYLNGEIEFKDETIKEVGGGGDPLHSLVHDVVNDGGQALIFVNTRRSTESIAKNLTNCVRPLLNTQELKSLTKLSKSLRRRDVETTSVTKILAEVLARGCAYHHAGLSNVQRKLIETNFKAGNIKCIVATPTLAAGINLPARRVIVRDVYRFDMAGTGRLVPIPILEIKQMMGRAGRPKYDSVGEAILVAKNQEGKDYIFDRYIFQDTEPIYSKLSVESALRTHILAAIATDIVNSEEQLHTFLNNTFFAYQESVLSIEMKLDDTLEFLSTEGFITTDAKRPEDRKLRATEFGKRTTQLYIDPLSAVKLKQCLSNSEDTNLTELSFLHGICTTPDMLKLYMRSNDYTWVQNVLTSHPNEFMLPVPEASHDYEWFLGEVKTAMLLVDWIQELPEDQIIAKYFVGPGDIYNKIETAEWLLYSMRELSRLLHYRFTKALNELITRIQYGGKKDLLGLTKLKGRGLVRARALSKAGYRKTQDLLGVDINKLSKIPTIGKRIAVDLKLQLGEKVSEQYKPQKSGSEEDLEGQKLLSDYD